MLLSFLLFFLNAHTHTHTGTCRSFSSICSGWGTQICWQLTDYWKRGKKKEIQFIPTCLVHKNTEVLSRYCANIFSGLAHVMKTKVNEKPFQNSHKTTAFITILASSSFTQCARNANFNSTMLHNIEGVGGAKGNGGGGYSAASCPEREALLLHLRRGWTGCVHDVAGHAGFHLPPATFRTRVPVAVFRQYLACVSCVMRKILSLKITACSF